MSNVVKPAHYADRPIETIGGGDPLTPTIAGEEAERWIRFSAWPM